MKFRYYGFHLKISGIASLALFVFTMIDVSGGGALNKLPWLGFSAAGILFIIFLSQLIFQRVVISNSKISIGKPFPQVVAVNEITKITHDKEKWFVHSPSRTIRINPNGLKEKDLKVVKLHLAELKKKLT
jgi:hypothetical protein